MELDQLLALALEHKWLPVIGILVAAIVRLLKSDTKLPTVPANWRAELALGLGLTGGVVEKAIANATPWQNALSDGLVVGLSAIVLHKVVDVARKGKDVPLPKALLKPEARDTIPPAAPPPPSSMKPPPMPPVPPPPPPSSLVAIVLLALGLVSCTPAELAASHAALSTIDAIARAVPRVVAMCEDAGADAVRVSKARDALEKKDYGTAIAEARAMVESLRSRGVPIPADQDERLALLEGAFAAEAIQNGMRALSAPSATPAPSTSAAPPGELKPIP